MAKIKAKAKPKVPAAKTTSKSAKSVKAQEKTKAQAASKTKPAGKAAAGKTLAPAAKTKVQTPDASKKPASKAKPVKKDAKAKKTEELDLFDDGDVSESEELLEYQDDLDETEEVEETATTEEVETDEEAPNPQAATENEEDIVLTDAEGNRYCRAKDCDQISMVESYCRYHYLLFWKKIQVRKEILQDGKLEKYVDDLTSRYPDKFLEMLRKDLRTTKDFLAAIAELEIDESAGENEFEEDAQTFIDEVRGISDTGATMEDDEF
jgi:hypothetical protein